MKTIRLVCVIILLLTVLIMTLTSCGSSLKGDKAVGQWTMSSVQYMNQELTVDQLIESGGIKESPSLIIENDGSCKLEFMQSSGKGKVTAGNDNTYTIKFKNENDENKDYEYSFEISNNELRLDDSANSMIMVFEKDKKGDKQ